MAITICPYCGARVPFGAKYCEYCGSIQVKEEPKKQKEAQPESNGNTVKITFPVVPGKMLINCARIEAYVKGVQIFEGGFKIQTVKFELSEPSNVSIKISRWPDKTFKYPIEPGKNYELVLRVADSGFGFDVDFKQKIDIIKV